MSNFRSRVVKRYVEKVLEQHAKSQLNLASSSARKELSSLIVQELEKQFCFSAKPFLPIDVTMTSDEEDNFDL